MRGRRISLIAAMALAIAGSAVPALGAAGHDGGAGPGAPSVLQKGEAAARAAQQAGPGDEGGGEEDEAAVLRARAAYAQGIQAAPARTFPVAATVAAQRAAQQLPVVGGRWRSPTDKPFVDDPVNRGANYGVGWGLVTGRMTALTASRGTVYAASASGGVWRSTDEGDHWSPVNRGLPRLSVGALGTDPHTGTVYVGTGEANNASENQYGTGVYRLDPRTDRWVHVGGRELYGSGVYTLLWHGSWVYAATNHGLYRRPEETSRTTPWVPVLQPDGPRKYPPSSSVTDVIGVPGSPGKLLAVVGWSGYSNPPETEDNGFYVGTGKASSWHRITPTGDIDPTQIGRSSFTSSGGSLYAVVTSSSPDTGGTLIGEGVFRSDDGPTGPWVRIADTDSLAASGSALGDSTSGYFPGIQGDYNQDITADPRDPDHVWLQLEEVFESTDGGATWLAVGPYWNYDIDCEEERGDPYDCPRTTHPDQHAGMVWRGRFWAGNDGGVWSRPTGWHDRGHWENHNAQIHSTQNYSVDVGQMAQGNAFWGGLQDNGESYTRSDMDRVEQAFTGDGGDTIVNPYNGDEAVEEYVFLDMYLTRDGAVADLHEISPSCLTASDPPDPCDPNPRFIAPIEKAADDPTHWVAGGQYVWDDTAAWRTVCNGTDGCDWEPVYDTGDGHQVTALAATGDTTYAAWCGGCNPPTFARGLATNYGGTWHELALDGVPSRYITSVAVDPGNAAHAWLSLGSYSRRWIPTAGYGHVFETTDGGETWTDVTGDLPDAPVYHLALQGRHLVAGSEVGAFVASTRTDGALSWARLGRGLPPVTVWDVVTRPNGLVVAGTHGRGDWVTSLR